MTNMTNMKNLKDMTTGEKLLEGVLKLAFEEEAADDAAAQAAKEAAVSVPAALGRRVRRRIRLHTSAELLRKHARGIAAVFVLALAVWIAVAVSGGVSADGPEYVLTSETDAYGQNLMVSFVTEGPEKTGTKTVVPLSASSALALPDGSGGSAPARTASYRTDAAYLEEYENGIRYEQCLLSAGGVTVIPVRDRTVKNIVIGGRSAVLIFDAQSAAILWQDGVCSYLLTGPFSADDAMRMARTLTGD